MKEKKQYLGLGKTKYNSGVCIIEDNSVQMFLSERMNRVKHSGAWPSASLKLLSSHIDLKTIQIAENRDVHRPSTIEDLQDLKFPFYDYLKKENLDAFASRYNEKITFLTHHLAHAYAAAAMSPFEKAVIIVLDGAGSNKEEFFPGQSDQVLQFEECSVYLFNQGKVENVFQRWVSFKSNDDHSGDRIGARYENMASFVFNSPHASGKVMGLASFGDRNQNVELDWSKSFKGKTKAEWELSDKKYFAHLSARIQGELENDYEWIVAHVKEKYPDYENVILTGGCALNCTNNGKILYEKKFSNIYVPPFPGDESISFGLAQYLYLKNNPEVWKPTPFQNQSAYLGPISSIPIDEKVSEVFRQDSFKIMKPNSVVMETAQLLNEGKIIAWFQGRSESGPRALGNRSILVRPDLKEVKKTLNQKIKFREEFRPYGCSVLKSYAHMYFDIDEKFENPYMSFAIRVRTEWKEKLKEVSHIDGTSRMQIVNPGQNKKFYELIKEFGDLSGIYCLLNTSLNIMDEPILETVEDAKRFLETSAIDYLVIGDFIISKI